MSRPGPDNVFDRGLQHERTALAWDRTGLAMAVASALLLRRPGQVAAIWFEAAGLAYLGIAFIVFIAGLRRYDRLHAILREGRPVIDQALIRLTGISTSGFAAIALLRVAIG